MQTSRALPPELSIYTVGELHPQWLAWLAETGDEASFRLDGSPVEQADAAGVQLLLALSAALKQRGLTLALQAPSQPLLDACSALGLGDWASRISHSTEGAAP
jgi:anti-anti-sigma regulatory factor